MKTRSLILNLLIAGRVGALFSVIALLVLLLAACARPQIGIGRTPTPSPAVAITRTPTPSPAPTSTLSPAPTATSQPSPRPALPTPTSIPTATPPAEAPAHVEALPMAIRPETLLLSAGDSACFYVGPLAPWRLGVRSSWSVDGLPAAATADARGPMAVTPPGGCLRIDASCALADGQYPLDVTAAVPGTTWNAQVTLATAACEEFKPGVYTGSMNELMDVIMAGKPDFTHGLVVPLRVLLWLSAQETRGHHRVRNFRSWYSVTKPPRFFLFYSLVRPAPDFIEAHNYEFSNVEHDYTTDSGWSLEETITPGLYLLVFEHDSYVDLVHPRQPSDILQSVTYRLEMIDISGQ